MVLYLRTKDNKTLFEANVWIDSTEERQLPFVELIATINISNYSNFLIENLKKKNKIISDFDNLNELRGWLWERFFVTIPNDGTKLDEVITKLRVILGKVAKDYDLLLIEE